MTQSSPPDTASSSQLNQSLNHYSDVDYDVSINHNKGTMTPLEKSGCTTCSPKEIYIRFLQNLYLIYSALEYELQRVKEETSFSLDELIFSEALFRRTAISRDLTFYLGIGWKSQLTSTRATDAYVQRIKQVARTDPDLLLVHHSSRYIGDLQTCDKSAVETRRVFDLQSETGDAESSAGVAFHHFNLVEDKEEFQREYFDRIRRLELPPEINEKMAKEAKLAYQLNLNLYWELQSMFAKAESDVDLLLDSKYQSLVSLDGNININKSTPSGIHSSESEEQMTAKAPFAFKKAPPRCRGFSLACYSLLFWFALWFLFGAIMWENQWVNIDDIQIFKTAKKKMHAIYNDFMNID